MKPWISFFFGLTLGFTGTAQAQKPVELPIQEFKLANGLTVIVQPNDRSPTAVHMLWLRAGAMDESPTGSGVAHVLEHMMFKGTPKQKPGEFSRRVAALGGQENAFTAREFTGYFQRIPSQHLPQVMQLEAERFAHNIWPDSEFTSEIEVVKQERRLRTDDSPQALLHEALDATAFIASSSRDPIVGWMSDLNTMQAQDVRDFYKRWYTPANAAVVVAGAVNPQQVLQWAQKYYGTIPARALAPSRQRPEPEQRGLRRVELRAAAAQAYIALAFKAPLLQAATLNDSTADPYALTLLAGVLDGYSGARLERDLTQGPQRIAESVNLSYNPTGRSAGVFMLTAVVAPHSTPAAVEQALRAQIERVAREGVGDAELQRVKTQWISSAVYKRDSLFNAARELGTFWAIGLPLDSSDRLIANLQKVTSAQIQAVAARYFSDNNLTVGVLWPQAPTPAKTSN